jgi:hypothetical protein
VAAHRFAADVWEGRRAALLRELRRQRDLAREAMERGEVDAAHERLSSETGVAAVAAQLWLEGAQQICSGKEQDGRLAEVTRAAGCPEAHALYRLVLAVEPERAAAAAPLLLRLGEQAVALYHSMGTLPPEEPERRREGLVWGAYVAHLTGTLSLAPGLGHPAHLYQSLRSIGFWAIEYPARVIAELREKGVSGVEALDRSAAEVSALAAQIRTILLGPLRWRELPASKSSLRWMDIAPPHRYPLLERHAAATTESRQRQTRRKPGTQSHGPTSGASRIRVSHASNTAARLP